jgi:hypothetical protein
MYATGWYTRDISPTSDNGSDRVAPLSTNGSPDMPMFPLYRIECGNVVAVAGVTL